MANVPCTIIVKSQDSLMLPNRMLYVICKQMFSFGIKEIADKQNQVQISLTYTPKGTTLEKKFGTLPVGYVKLHIDGEDDLELFRKAINTFRFLTDSPDPDSEDAVIAVPSRMVEESPPPPPPSPQLPPTPQPQQQQQQQQHYIEQVNAAPVQRKRKTTRHIILDDEDDVPPIFYNRSNDYDDDGPPSSSSYIQIN